MKRFTFSHQSQAFTRTTLGRRSMLSLLFLLGLATLPGAAMAQNFAPGFGESKGRQWAILIGVEDYKHAQPLSYTINDVDQLSATLQERGGVSPRNIVTFVDNASTVARQPLRASLLEHLPEWFKKPAKNDRLLVYFSGHGFQSSDGKLYLAPIDCDPARPEATGLSVAWLREQIAGCQAETKLLVLDACHAGTEKGEEEFKSLPAKDLGEPFRDLEGVVTLASSRGSEKSQIWSEKRQSLFTYWLNQGLKGHADENGDGTVDIDELNKYVYEAVTHTSKTRFHREQTPVRIIRSEAPGVPVVLELAPLKLKHLISDMADQIILSMESRDIKQIGVLQFTTDTQFGEALGGEFGALGRWCAAELEQRLIEAGTFEVIDSRELVAMLKKHNFTVDQLGSREALDKLSASLGGLPAIALGTLRHRQNRMITLQCKLKRIDTNSLAGASGGTALLNESEWAMLGRSVAIKPADRPAPIPGGSPQEELIQRLDQKAEGPHPLADPRFPYRVAIYVDGRERKGEFRGNDYVVPLAIGEYYAIRITMLNNDVTHMKLLVDGLNTLPQKVQLKGLETMEIAPIVKLDEARGWLMDPIAQKQHVYEIRGFVTETGAAGKLRRFKIVDDGLSLAAQKKYTDNIGLITAAFYAPASERGGTGLDEVETQERIIERKGISVGDLMGVVNIRYVDPSEFKGGR